MHLTKNVKNKFIYPHIESIIINLKFTEVNNEMQIMLIK